MSESSHLAEALQGLFSTPDLFLFTSYPAAVDGLTAAQAACSPGPRLNSVWRVTLHLTICQRFALAVLRGDKVDMNIFFAESAWPSIQDPLDGPAWEGAKTGVLTANYSLSECVAGFPTEKLEQDLPIVDMKAYAYIQGQLAHNSHHLNEIISIRHMQGLWLEKT
jgi:hypothetical protein